MIFIVVIDQVVQNVFEAESAEQISEIMNIPIDYIFEGELGMEEGGKYINGVYEPLIVENPIPEKVSRMQLLTALVIEGFITPQEAINANFEVPLGIQAVLSNLSPEEQVAGCIKWLNFTEAYRFDDLVIALIAAQNMTEQEVDDFFRLASTL